MTSLRRRIRFQVAAAVGSVVLGLLTLVTREWIEVVFGVDLDRGQGWLEWLVVAGCAAAAAGAAFGARRDLLRLRTVVEPAGIISAA